MLKNLTVVPVQMYPEAEGKPLSLLLVPSDFLLQLQKTKVLRSQEMQDPTLLAMEISIRMNTAIPSGIGLARLVGYIFIILGNILNSYQIGT